jgi:hypothetical protein
MIHRVSLFLLVLLCAALSARGQIGVTLEIKRRAFVRYEPLLATVRITNNSGRDLMLHDAEHQWFGFDITGHDTTTLVPPRNPDYKLDPLEIKLGETVKRTVDLTQLYALSEYGLHRIKATVFVKELNKLFASKAVLVDITEGRTIWQTSVGVPETLPNAGATHRFRLLEYQDDKRQLYVRVEDENDGSVFCTYKVGHIIDGTQPQMQFDTTNNLYVLQLVAPKTYMLTNIGVNGEFYGQHLYDAPKYKPYFRKLADGSVQIVGARRQQTAANSKVAGAPPPPKLSERPPNLPQN